MYYLLHINNFLVKKDNDEIDFLYEMYNSIKELYLKLWYLKNISTSITKNEQINQLNNKIKDMLEIYNIPEYIVLKEDKDKYIEPISNISFDISNHTVKQKISKEEAEELIVTLKLLELKNNSTFFSNDLEKFNNIMNEEKIK